MWQIAYPLQMVQVWVAIFVLKFDSSQKTLSKSGLNKDFFSYQQISYQQIYLVLSPLHNVYS